MDIKKYPQTTGNTTPDESSNSIRYKDCIKRVIKMINMSENDDDNTSEYDNIINNLLDLAWKIYDALNTNKNIIETLISIKDLSRSFEYHNKIVIYSTLNELYITMLENVTFNYFRQLEKVVPNTPDNIRFNNIYIQNILNHVDLININLGMSKNILEVVYNININKYIDSAMIQTIINSSNGSSYTKILNLIDEYNEDLQSFNND